MVSYANRGALPIIITVLALADGILHFALDFILFRGRIFGSGRPPGPPPGTRPGGPPPGPAPLVPMPFPLNEMFLLNLIGWIVLVVLFWLGPSLLGRTRWIVDVLMILYAAVTILGWLEIGHPNPMGLGYLAKAIEVVLIVALLVHLSRVLGRQRTASTVRG